MNKVVSIITPSFNRSYIIDETAQSIFNQTYPHWEWVITDDGSTDDSWQKLLAYAEHDARVKIYKRDREPKGACICRNIAVEKCTGDYVMFLDTDDVLASFCLEQRVKAMQEDSGCDFMIFPMMLFKKQLDDTRLLWNIDKDEDDLHRILIGDPVCQGTGPLWKKSSFIDVGMWREDLKLWQDIELHIRSLLYPVKYKKQLHLKPDVFLRISDDSLSRVGYYAPAKMRSRVDVFLYACKEIETKGSKKKYLEGLRSMGSDIINSCIISGYKEGVNTLIDVCGSQGLFSNAELSMFRNYHNAVRYKIHRIPFLFNRIQRKAHSIIKSKESTVSAIEWQEDVHM